MFKTVRLTILALPVLSHNLFAAQVADSALFPLSMGLAGSTIIFGAIAYFAFSRNKNIKSKCQDDIERAKDEAFEASKAKDTFLANVSHETRTPMNAIIGLSHILLQSDLSHDQKVNLLKIKRSAEHLMAITNDILDYSKLEAGRLDLEHRDFEVADFLIHLADIVAASAVEKKLDLLFHIDKEIPESLHSDPLRLSQVLINLLNNAIKFTEEGEVTLKVSVLEATEENPEKQVLFEVLDTGIGMSDDQVSKLFKAFSQADNKVSRKYGGTGLGLAISKQLTEMMGGTLDVNSKFRVGSNFFFSLPCFIGPDAAPEPQNKLTMRLLTNKEVLIIDQSPNAAAMMANILGTYNSNPKIATTPTEIKKLLQWNHFDAICIDSRMISNMPPAKVLRESTDNIVLLKYDILDSPAVSSYERDAIINKPFIPMTVLSAMTDIFGKNIQENKLEKEKVTFEDILVLKGAKVLLVEDNEGNRMVVEGLLDGSGIETYPAVNGQKAVEAVFSESSDYDLILMDINMPIMDGFSATSIIREYQKYDDIPIVAMTANITESDMNKSKSYGMQGHLGKPVNVDEFYKTLLKFIPAKVKIGDVKPVKEVSQTVAPQPAESASIDNLPGVDTKDGLSRLNGNMKAYQNVMKKFADLFENVIPEFKKLVDAKAHEDGRALAHNLKGLSGNIGAKKIFELAKELEDSFKDGQGEFIPLLQMLQDNLTPLVSAIKTMQSANSSIEDANKEILTPAAMDGIMSELYLSAKKKKAVAVKKICDELEKYAWPATYKQILQEIVDLARAYKFADVTQKIEKNIPEVVA